jgi:GrpB-like predicted nucleotidyltransferase (UPF0157 family)
VAVREAWPAWATEKIEIVEPDPAWERRAAELGADLGRRLAHWLDGRVEHVGSTAVLGLAAKPVLDLMAPMRSLADSADADATLAGAGWKLVPPELDRRPWRRMYVLPDGSRRAAHLHLIEPAHPRWREALAFRDELRRRPDLVAAYAGVKRAAAHAHGDDREAYTAAKSAFVRRVIRDAR